MPKVPVPAYWLYGERRDERLPDALHIETIVARSSLHGWRIQPHRHQGMLQFFLISAGGGRARIDGEDFLLAPGTAILMPPLVIHEFLFDLGTNGFVASVADVTLKPLADTEPSLGAAFGRPTVLRQGAEDVDLVELAALMQTAHAEYGRNRSGRESALSAHAGLIAIWFLRAASRERQRVELQNDARAALVRRFLDRAEADFRSHRPLSAYARALGVSVPHLTRTCREVLGAPATKVIQDRLMLEARRYLVYTSMSISQIAFGLGFSDPAYFSRFFAARAGVTPSGYRAAG